jgi:hypothetical protein
VTSSKPRRHRQFSSTTATCRGDPVAVVEQLQERIGQIFNSFLHDPDDGRRQPRRAGSADVDTGIGHPSAVALPERPSGLRRHAAFGKP